MKNQRNVGTQQEQATHQLLMNNVACNKAIQGTVNMFEVIAVVVSVIVVSAIVVLAIVVTSAAVIATTAIAIVLTAVVTTIASV